MGLIRCIREFGIWNTFISSISRPLKYIDNRLASWYTCNIKTPILSRYIEKKYGYCIDESFTTERSTEEKKIWVIWLQGLDKAPDFVKACIWSIDLHTPGHQLVVITSENYRRYVDIPDYIEKKFLDGKMCPMHFSDILRFYLINRYGGVYFDATSYMLSDLPEHIYMRSFYSLPNVLGYPLNFKWTSFHMAGDPNNVFSRNMCRFYEVYWREHDEALSYVILDYYMKAICSRSESAKIIINNIPDAESPFYLQRVLNHQYFEDGLKPKNENDYFQKISYQSIVDGSVPEKLDNGCYTFYGQILKEFRDAKGMNDIISLEK